MNSQTNGRVQRALSALPGGTNPGRISELRLDLRRLSIRIGSQPAKDSVVPAMRCCSSRDRCPKECSDSFPDDAKASVEKPIVALMGPPPSVLSQWGFTVLPRGMIQPAEVTAGRLVERVEHLINSAGQVRSRLAEIIPVMKERALRAGDLLNEALTRSGRR